MTPLVPAFFDESSSYLQVTRTTIKAGMSLNLVSFKLELPVIEHHKV